MKIIIKREAYNKIQHWVKRADFEVSGFGKVVRTTDAEGVNTFTVITAHLLKQTGGSAHTDIDQAALAKLMYTSRDTEGELKWWWHSHVNMPVFWSGTDTETIQEMGVNGWIIATVFNKRNENKSALCYRTESDFGYNHELVDNIDFAVEEDNSPAIKDWDDEFDANVVKEAPAAVMKTSEVWKYNPTLGVQPSLLQNGDVVGLISDSAMTEARSLGIAFSKYKDMILDDNDVIIDQLITKLLEQGAYRREY